MARFTFVHAGIAAALAALAWAAPAEAQATRTWVSGVGDDVNPCSRTAPCKTFAGAISKTAAGGEISIIDAAGYGAVTITKSISIVAEGPEGSILGSSTTGIVVNAGANDTVSLQGIFIEGGVTGLNGIRVLGAGQVHVRDCLIRGFRGANAGAGILVEPISSTRVFVSGTTVAANNAGIVVKTLAAAGSPTASVILEDVDVVQNVTAGVTADGPGSSIWLNRSTIAQNATGLAATGKGQIASFGNNVNVGNGQNGAPTSTLPLQ